MILIWTGDAPSPLHAVFMIVMILKYFAPRKYICVINIICRKHINSLTTYIN